MIFVRNWRLRRLRRRIIEMEGQCVGIRNRMETVVGMVPGWFWCELLDAERELARLKARKESLETRGRVDLDGDALVFRVKSRGRYYDRVYVRDENEPKSNNVWVRLPNYEALRERERAPC